MGPRSEHLQQRKGRSRLASVNAKAWMRRVWDGIKDSLKLAEGALRPVLPLEFQVQDANCSSPGARDNERSGRQRDGAYGEDLEHGNVSEI